MLSYQVEARCPCADSQTEVCRFANTMSDLLHPFCRVCALRIPPRGVNGCQRRNSPRLRMEIIQLVGGFECLCQEQFFAVSAGPI